MASKEQKPTLPIAPERIAEIRELQDKLDKGLLVIEKFKKEEIIPLHEERIGNQDCGKAYDLGLLTAGFSKASTKLEYSVYRDTLDSVLGDHSQNFFDIEDVPQVVDIVALIKAMVKNKINPNLVLDVKLKKGFEPSVLTVFDTGKEDSPVKCYKVLVPKDNFFSTCYAMWKSLSKDGRELVKDLASKMFSLTLKKI